MKYINDVNSEYISFLISLQCEIQYNFIPKEIVNLFKKHSEIKEHTKIKSRIEYLDKELKGVEISNKNYKSIITPNKIRLSINTDFNTVYDELKSYFKNKPIKLPNKNKFIVESIIIYSDDENINVHIDETKTNECNKIINQIYIDEKTNMTGCLGQLDDMVGISFAWENKKYSYNESFKYLNNLLSNNVLYVSDT